MSYRHDYPNEPIGGGNPYPGTKVWLGVAICGVGFVALVINIGWGASIGIALAMWGYRLQMEGTDDLERETSDGVGVLDDKPATSQPPSSGGE